MAIKSLRMEDAYICNRLTKHPFKTGWLTLPGMTQFLMNAVSFLAKNGEQQFNPPPSFLSMFDVLFFPPSKMDGEIF